MEGISNNHSCVVFIKFCEIYKIRYVMSAVIIETIVAGIKYLKLLLIDDLKYWAVKTKHRCVGAIR